MVRLHVSTPMHAAVVLPTHVNIYITCTQLVLGIMCAVAAAAAAVDQVVTLEPMLVMCVTFRYILGGLSMIFFKL